MIHMLIFCCCENFAVSKFLHKNLNSFVVLALSIVFIPKNLLFNQNHLIDTDAGFSLQSLYFD